MTSATDQMMSIEVEPRLLIRASEAVMRAHEEGAVEPGSAMFTVFGELSHEVEATTLAAIIFRLEALSRIVREEKAGGWVLGDPGNERVFVNEAVFFAAAKARLLHVEKRGFVFDHDDFLRHALLASETEGHS